MSQFTDRLAAWFERNLRKQHYVAIVIAAHFIILLIILAAVLREATR